METGQSQHQPRYFGDEWSSILTHRPLPNGVKNVVLDANVLLDAALITDGAGINALKVLLSRGCKLFTSDKAVHEAYSRLVEYRKALPPITPLLTAMLRGIDVVTTEGQHSGISSHDAHLAIATTAVQGVVLSEDLPFIYDANFAKIHARTIREILISLENEPDAVHEAAFYSTILGADGHIFAIASALEGIFDTSRHFNLFEASRFCRVLYDSGSSSFKVVTFDERAIINLPFDLEPMRTFAIALEYSIGKNTQVFLRICDVVSGREVRGEARLPLLVQPPIPQVTWLNRFEHERGEGWLGHLQVGTFGPYRLARKTWRACKSIIGVAPSTLTADQSFIAALLCEVQDDRCRRPTWAQIHAMMRISIPGFYPGRRRSERKEEWFTRDLSEHTPFIDAALNQNLKGKI